MNDIPFSIKLMHSLGLIKVKQVEQAKLQPQSTISTFDGIMGTNKGTLPKGFTEKTNAPIQNKKNTISFKPQRLVVLIPIFIMILIPALILVNNHSSGPISPAQSSPANQISLDPIEGKYTDAQIISKYPMLTDLDKALKSGELKLDQVSDNMRGMIKQQKLGGNTP